jgi:hypothetical protein
MNAREKAIFMRQWHGEHALIQAQQVLALSDTTINAPYWIKVVEILSVK